MCLALLALQQHPEHPIIILSNRDEYYQRPTERAAFWPDYPSIYAARDMVAGGTWLGVTQQGRFALVTNYREPRQLDPAKASRGHLVRDYLAGTEEPADFLSKMHQYAKDFNGFNLIVGSSEEAFYFSNIDQQIKALSAGIYGVSNHLLDTPWPKVTHAKALLTSALTVNSAVSLQQRFFAILTERRRYPDEELPRTGIAIEQERKLSAIFIEKGASDYGTTASTVVLFSKAKISFTQRVYNTANTLKYEDKAVLTMTA